MTEIVRRTQLSPNYTAGRNMALTGIVIHWWGDPANRPTLLGTVAWLCNRSSQVSAHYVVSGRTIYQLVDEANMAWDAREANSFTIGIEVDPNTPEGTYETVAWLVADICRRRRFNPANAVKGHRVYVDTQCPGTLDLNRIIGGAQAQLSGASPEQEDMNWRAFVDAAYRTWQPKGKPTEDAKNGHAAHLATLSAEQLADWVYKFADDGDVMRTEREILVDYQRIRNEINGDVLTNPEAMADNWLAGGASVHSVLAGDLRSYMTRAQQADRLEGELRTRTQERDTFAKSSSQYQGEALRLTGLMQDKDVEIARLEELCAQQDIPPVTDVSVAGVTRLRNYLTAWLTKERKGVIK